MGFDWHPVTKELWFTDNGADNLGDDVPPDELNHAPKQGLNFGYPYCHGGDIPDPQFGKKRSCSEFTSPAQKLGAHVAALGMRFYTGSMFPAEYRNQIFIAEHGSWNRSTPIGYRITVVQLDNNRAVSYKPFAEGWLQGSRAWGRPVDVLVMPDGALLVSDDSSRGHLPNPLQKVSVEPRASCDSPTVRQIASSSPRAEPTDPSEFLSTQTTPARRSQKVAEQIPRRARTPTGAQLHPYSCGGAGTALNLRALKNPVSGPIVMFVKSFFIVPVQTIGVEFWPALNRLSG